MSRKGLRDFEEVSRRSVAKLLGKHETRLTAANFVKLLELLHKPP